MSELRAAGVSISSDHVTLVNEVTAVFPSGRWTTIVGPNGAGKTTLVEALAGVRSVTRGTIFLNDIALSSLSERERARNIAFVPQHPVIPFGMSVRDYVALGRTPHHSLFGPPTSADEEVVVDVLVRLDLLGLSSRAMHSLSGGERQRAVLGRALAQGTKIIILDEPTTGLDVRHQFEVLELLRREVDHGVVTIIATLHDLTLAGQFAQDVVLMDHGEVLLSGPAKEVIRSPQLAESYEMTLRVVDVDGSDVIIPVPRDR